MVLFNNSSKIVLIVEYDGRRYYGFQWQKDLPTIQAELESAIWKLTAERKRVIAASRTDAGVHARGQVVSFWTGSSLPPRTFVKALNYYLPGDIAVKAASRVDESFNVRRDALSREYVYRILNVSTRAPLIEGFAYLVANNLNNEIMNKASQLLEGERDISSFITSLSGVKNTLRTIYKAEVTREGDMVTFRMVADSFLLHQIRNTVGSLIKVGLRKMTIEEFNNIIEARTPGLAGPAVPAYGLCLTKVNYPDNLESKYENLFN